VFAGPGEATVAVTEAVGEAVAEAAETVAVAVAVAVVPPVGLSASGEPSAADRSVAAGDAAAGEAADVAGPGWSGATVWALTGHPRPGRWY